MVKISEVVSSSGIAGHAPENALKVVNPVETTIDLKYDDPITKTNFKEGEEINFLPSRHLLDELFEKYEVE